MTKEEDAVVTRGRVEELIELLRSGFMSHGKDVVSEYHMGELAVSLAVWMLVVCSDIGADPRDVMRASFDLIDAKDGIKKPSPIIMPPTGMKVKRWVN